MLIPRELSRITSHADTESSRYALGAVKLERDENGQPIAIATDGRRLAAIKWQEPEIEYGTDFDTAAVDGFEALISVDHFKAGAAVAKPKRKSRSTKEKARGVDFFALEEPSVNGQATFYGSDLKSSGSTTEETQEGRFPKWRDVIPKQDIDFEFSQLVGLLERTLSDNGKRLLLDDEAGIVNPVDDESDSLALNDVFRETFQGLKSAAGQRLAERFHFGPVKTITLDWRYLADACELLGRVASTEQSRGIDLTIKDHESAIVISHPGDTSKPGNPTGEIVLMPLSRDRR